MKLKQQDGLFGVAAAESQKKSFLSVARWLLGNLMPLKHMYVSFYIGFVKINYVLTSNQNDAKHLQMLKILMLKTGNFGSLLDGWQYGDVIISGA